MTTASMNEREQIEMMRRASDEIKTLRAEIGRLQPKADAYEKLSQVLGLLPQPSRGYGEDVAWMLDKRIKEIEAGIAAEKANAEKANAAAE